MDFNSLLGNATIEIKCPNCSSVFEIKINQVGSKVNCPSCNVSIELQADESFDSSVESVNESLDELEDTLNNFGK